MSFIRDLKDGILDDGEHVAISQRDFDTLDDYTQSSPTAPSLGRIWKKNFHWSGPPANWFVCYTFPDDVGDSWTAQRPALVVSP